MSAIEQAMRALLASDAGDTEAAQHLISVARCRARSQARRSRQLVEIASLIVAGNRGRAAGLAVEHTAEFPDDDALLRRFARPDPR
jgi:hypothetical protein